MGARSPIGGERVNVMRRWYLVFELFILSVSFRLPRGSVEPIANCWKLTDTGVSAVTEMFLFDKKHSKRGGIKLRRFLDATRDGDTSYMAALAVVWSKRFLERYRGIPATIRGYSVVLAVFMFGEIMLGSIILESVTKVTCKER